MKKIYLILFFLTLAIGIYAQSGTYTANGVTWKYQLEGSPLSATITGEIQGKVNFTGALNIPDNIIHAGISYPVTKIGLAAFNDYQKATSLHIPESITEIDNGAFLSCWRATGTLSLPNVTRIGTSAFRYCEKLTGSLSLPKMIRIENGAFFGCERFTGTLSLPNVTEIEPYAFNKTGFTKLIAPKVISIGEMGFFDSSLTGELSLPSAISIGPSAFQASQSITALSLPSATTIGFQAFHHCTSFTGTLSLPNAITIGQGAFRNCPFTGELSLPKVTSIGGYAFENCSSFSSISIPKIEKIEARAFYNCNSLVGEITIPSTIQEIGSMAFMECRGLEKVKFENGASLTAIGANIFENCNYLEYIDMAGCTFPSGVEVKRIPSTWEAGFSATALVPFGGLQPYVMVYLPSTVSAAVNGEENFVVGNTCDNFVVYQSHHLHYYKHGIMYNNYVIQHPFQASKATFTGRSFVKEYSTICLPYPATVPNDMRAYELKARVENGTYLSFVSVGDGGTQLEANKPYLLRLPTGGVITLYSCGIDQNVQVPVTPAVMEYPASNDGTTFFGGTTKVIDNPTSVAMKLYNLHNGVWNPIQTSDINGWMGSLRAYIRIDGSSPAKGFAMVLDDNNETTNIDSIVQDIEQGDGKIYSLDGKFMGIDINQLRGGTIYIKNGKKFYKF